MSSGFHDLLEDLFSPLGGVTFRKMFGGLGIFRDGIMFAMVADDTLYMKVDSQNAAPYEAEDCEPFIYSARGRQTTMSYRRVPERLYDEADEFGQWARSAFDAARRSKKPDKKPNEKKKASRR